MFRALRKGRPFSWSVKSSRAGCSECTQHEQDVGDGHHTVVVEVTVAIGGAAEDGKQKEDIVDANGSVIVQVAEAVACGLEAAAQGARVPTMQVLIHMVALLVHRHAIVGPFVTWIEITRAAEAGLVLASRCVTVLMMIAMA